MSRPLRSSGVVASSLAALLIAPPLLLAAPPREAASQLQTQPIAAQSQPLPDRSSAYYHYGLAHLYEEMAINAGRQDYATQAVEEYKLALDADPASALLQDGLADLYFKIGRNKDAVEAAEDQVKRDPNDVVAHSLLGKIYLRSLGDMQGAQATELLQRAITEYETIARLKPTDVETKLLLGQLYALDHDSAKAEAEFKAAQKIDADSEEVVLNMARLYSEEGDVQRASDTLAAVPVADRSARVEFALAVSLEQLKKPKQAAEAYRRSLELEPDNPDAQHGLATALLNDDQLDAALTVLNALVAADPNDAQSQIHISEIQRRQGHYDLALATLEKAKLQVQDSLELSYNEALIYDALGKYDKAISVLTGILDSSAHSDGKYSEQEKANRTIFLDRLGIIDRELNKTSEAVAAYKQIVALGGDYVARGYDGEIDAYRDAHQWKEATATAAEVAKILPKSHLAQLVYANQLADTGQVNEGIALAKAQLTGGADDRDVEEALAQMYIRLKRFSEASEQLDKASVLATKNDDRLYVCFLRGEFYDRQKLYAQAEEQFRKALAIDPQNATVLNYLGYMLADQGQKLPEALKMIQQAVDLDPQNGAYLDSLGWVYFKSGKYAEAEENLHKAIERISTDPSVHDHLGQLYEKTGRLKLAVAQWERSMAEYAHSLAADAEPEDVQKVQHRLESTRVKLAKLGAASYKAAK
ncbi:MAG: tetratricopeptide repeat protein [Acidobacteriaceae bacterium]|nr:tetratricopeptide repeat protein [Acidobacteriaceae bacterium]